jgi:hypothetical protein
MSASPRWSSTAVLDDGDPGPCDQPPLALTSQIGLEDKPPISPELEPTLELDTTTSDQPWTSAANMPGS